MIDVEKVFASKNFRLLKWIPGFLIRYLKRIVHQEDLNCFLRATSHLKDIDFANAILDKFKIHVDIKGVENLPAEGRFILASNHPLGGIDGMVLIHGVSQRYRNLQFPVNDILMNLSQFSGIFIPINKHGSTGKNAVRIMESSFASDHQILMFPAGMVSRKTHGQIVDSQWKKTFVAKAVQHQRDIIPVHISGQNSAFFYNLHNWRNRIGIKANLEMLYLVDEMYRQTGNQITIIFGQPIPWQSFKAASPQETADKIKAIAYGLGEKS